MQVAFWENMRMNAMTHRILKIILAFILLQPFLALAHEILVFGVANLVDSLDSSDVLFQILKQFITSPVHAQILTETLGGIHADGIVAIGIFGQILHQVLPSVFLDPAKTIPHGFASAILDKNSTVLGLFATQAIVEFLLMVFGIIVLKLGLKKRSIGYVLKDAPLFDALRLLVGLFIIAQAIWLAFDLTLSSSVVKLRETGIGVGLSLFMQMDKATYNWLMDEFLPVLIPTVLTATAIGGTWLAFKLALKIRFALTKQVHVASSWSARVMHKVQIAVALTPLLVMASAYPRYFGMAETKMVAPIPVTANVVAQTIDVVPTPVPPTPAPLPSPTPTIEAPRSLAPVFLPTVAPTATPLPSPTPTQFPLVHQTELIKVGPKFILAVDGQARFIKGMNYNVNYTALPDDAKRKYHLRDFKIMRDAGINAVIGWGIYDQVTLEIARQFGIGVFMPFELDAHGAYDNQNYRNQVKDVFRKFVLQYKDSPAVWGWNPGGDELLHRMETEQHRTPDKLQAASDFLLELSTLAYSLDSRHVSIIKEPRDWYVPYVEESLRRARKQNPAIDPNRYFIFAVNTYGKPDGVSLVLSTTRQAVENRMNIAFAVGEFAPFGLAKTDRAANYKTMWDSVREQSSLGGFAYVFGPDQPNPKAPNPYDPLRLLVSEFSLLDNEGNPVDGSFNALASEWQQ
jgi:hypothetical protein